MREEEVKEDQSGGGAEKEKKAGEDTVHDEKLLVLMNCHLNFNAYGSSRPPRCRLKVESRKVKAKVEG